MASQSFSGAIATQEYQWGYRCELCGKDVVKTGSFSMRQGSTHKATTYAYTNSAGAQLMKQQAAALALVHKEEMNEKIRSGGFEAPKNENGRCPFCKQYQHWSPRMTEFAKQQQWTEKEKKGDRRAGGCLNTFLGAMAGMVVMIVLLTTVKTVNPTVLAIGGFLFGMAATWALAILISKKKGEKDAETARALETAEKNEPYFIAWGELKTDTTGLSITP